MLKTIVSFGNKNTEKLFYGEIVRKWAKIGNSARTKLRLLNNINSLTDLTNAFAARLHKLHGDRVNQWSISINKQYRICFYWIKKNAHKVEITDYH